MNQKVEQNKKNTKENEFIPKSVNIPLMAYNMCWYIAEEYKEKFNFNKYKLDDLILQIYLTWPYYKRIHPINEKSGD